MECGEQTHQDTVVTRHMEYVNREKLSAKNYNPSNLGGKKRRRQNKTSLLSPKFYAREA